MKKNDYWFLAMFLCLMLWVFLIDRPPVSGVFHFIDRYVGVTAIVLMPMAIFTIAAFLLRILEPIYDTSVWSRGLGVISTQAMNIGILGTFIGSGMALMAMGESAFLGDGTMLLVSSIGTCIWSTVTGLVVSISAYLIIEFGIVEVEEP